MAMAGIWKPKAWAQEGLRRHNPGYVDPRNPGNDNLNLNLFRIFLLRQVWQIENGLCSDFNSIKYENKKMSSSYT